MLTRRRRHPGSPLPTATMPWSSGPSPGGKQKTSRPAAARRMCLKPEVTLSPESSTRKTSMAPSSTNQATAGSPKLTGALAALRKGLPRETARPAKWFESASTGFSGGTWGGIGGGCRG